MLYRFQKSIKYIILGWSVFFLTEQASGQFTITDNFKGSVSPGIIIGDDAKLTSGLEDPVNAGWLRLTSDDYLHKGYAYVNKSFPSTLGVLIDFEYTMWRTRDRAYNNSGPAVGADGLSVFLFDEKYGPNTADEFALGAYGGSLGYANMNADLGLKGGYLGIGFDSKGNFAAALEGRNGGAGAARPNSIVLRGPTTDNAATTNRFLDGVTILEIPGGGFEQDSITGVKVTNPLSNVVDYNVVTAVRPTPEQFYRRVQVEIVPIGTGMYTIKVRWATEFGGELKEIINYETTDTPPEFLKVGFAAATGWDINNHEVRNLLVSTPGNLRVIKRANQDILRSIPRPTGTTEGPSNEIEYRIEVVNDTNAELEAIEFTDKLTDAHGNPIPTGTFTITSITHSGFLAGTALPSTSIASPISAGEFSGTLNLGANATGIIKVKGELKDMPDGNVLNNTTSAFPTTIVDQDLLNNTSTVGTPVVSEESDLVITSEVDQSCLVGSGNRFNLEVSNIGVLNLTYGNSLADNRLTVTATLPAGAEVGSWSHDGWTRTNADNTYTFTRANSGILNSGQSFAPISFTVESGVGYEITAIVASTAEPLENRTNNNSNSIVSAVPLAPTVVHATLYYCLGATATSLEAIADEGNKLLWYLNEGGSVSPTAFTPITSTPGTTTYYVTQQADGGCESDLTQITVIVLPETTAGNITGDLTICINSAPITIGSVDVGTGEGAITYRWESSVDGENWVAISEVTGPEYQPAILQRTTSYRRITVATTTEITCESEPTDVVTIVTKKCKIISNPMLPSKAKQN